MENRDGDRKDDRTKVPATDRKKPYEPPVWEDEEILEKTALACVKTPKFCRPANS